MALFRLKKDIEEEKSSQKDVVTSGENTESKTDAKVKVSSDKKNVHAKLKNKNQDNDISSNDYKKDISLILKHPRVTEKATVQSEKGVYVFDISPRANKKDVFEAIKSLYKVTPKKINIVKVPSKRVRLRGQQNKYGVKSGGKKAYVYVKGGDTIDIV